MITIATLLGGGEGVGVGARQADLVHLWGIEKDPDISQVAFENGFCSRPVDIFDVDPAAFVAPDILHVSPECQRASLANQDRGETDLDRAMADRIVRFLVALKPKVFTLENVGPYQNFESFKMILYWLANYGYMHHHDILDAADFGVPQTRRRLILRAVRHGLVPPLPAPEPHKGWYQAIEDLIPALPESHFAPWQSERLPAVLKRSTLFSQNESCDQHGNGYGKVAAREMNEPALTVTTEAVSLKAFIMAQGGENGDLYRYAEEPAPTVTTLSPTAVRAWLSQGRVVKMTPRAIARFQSFPDGYKLPSKAKLAAKVIGNACPPLMMEKLLRQLAEVIQ